MATAVSNTYNVGSGEEMFVGYAEPSWLPSTGFYAEIPLSAKLSDIDPEDDPLINPNHPSNSPWHGVAGQGSMMSAWCGASFDDVEGIVYIPLSEGHTDGGSNAPYKLNIMDDAPTPVMLRNPTGAIGNEGVLDDGLEASGVYFDGRPRAVHSYNNHVYVPNLGSFMAAQGSTTYKSGQNGVNDSLLFDNSTGESIRLSAPQTSGSSTTAGATYDNSRDCVWWKSAGTGKINKWDVATRTWSEHGSLLALPAGGVSITYIPTHDVILIVNNGAASKITIFDCVTELYTEPATSGSFVGYTINPASQFRYVPDGEYLAVWDNSSDTETINTLTIPANPRTDTWNIGQIAIDAGNTVTPTVRQGNGTFGRFFYSQVLGGFGIWNSVDQNPYFVRVR